MSTIKRFAQTVDSYEKQRSRDKMIVKFREDRILKLEQQQPPTQDEKQKQIQDLKKELAIWKESAENNA